MARRKSVSVERIADGKKWEVVTGDAKEVCRALEERSFDAVLCDPPYGLRPDGRTCTWDDVEAGRAAASGGFMGKAWDSAVPGPSLWREVLRVLKPGAPLIAFFGTRTYHRGACAVEDGGFVACDMFSWLHGEGWPKGLDVSKAVDELLGAERRVTGRVEAMENRRVGMGTNADGIARPRSGLRKEEPATSRAATWRGYNTQLKPACEPAILARRPLEGSFAENALEWGVGPYNVEDCRVGHDRRWNESAAGFGLYGPLGGSSEISGRPPVGRYPSNVILGHEPGCEMLGTVPSGETATITESTGEILKKDPAVYGTHYVRKEIGVVGRPDHALWNCVPGCVVRRLDEQAGERPAALTGRADPNVAHDVSEMTSAHPKAGEVLGRPGGTGAVYADSGGPSRYYHQVAWAPGELEEALASRERFVYAAKASGAERGAGNDHPSVKPMSLMRYLATLVLPPRPGRILVPFCGSGSEMLGAMLAGWTDVVGIELDPRMADVARWRVENAVAKRTSVDH